MGLLDRAKNMFQGRPATAKMRARSRTQYYRVACALGHVLHGERTEGYQALRCPECGEGIFVLPRSPLPEPVAPASMKGGASAARGRAGPARDELVLADPPSADEAARARAGIGAEPAEVDDEGEIEWVDDEEQQDAPPTAATRPAKAGFQPYNPETSLEQAAAVSRPAPTAKRPTPAPTARPAKAAAPVRQAPPTRMIEVEDHLSFAEWVVRHRNALIFGAVGLVLATTAVVMVRNRRLEELPALIERGRTEGLLKLETGEFLSAKKILGEAASAVDALGGQVAGADEIRQAAREAAIFADALSEPLEDLIEKAARDSSGDWSSRFNSTYKNQAIVLSNALVTEVADPAKTGSQYDVDYRIYKGGDSKPVFKGRIDFAGFKLFELARPNKGDLVVFGARINGVRLNDATGEFEVSLVPDSGVFITHPKALEAINPVPIEAPAEGDAPR